jgi:hypothetical protein
MHLNNSLPVPRNFYESLFQIDPMIAKSLTMDVATYLDNSARHHPVELSN